MLLRPDPEDAGAVIAVSQPCHGWVAGQLARAWGSDLSGAFAPREDVCLAAEQHDLAWAAWERAPTLNPESGRPHTFATLPLRERLSFWPGACERLVLPQSRYAALLVSLHATNLHATSDTGDEAPEVAGALAAFLEDESALRERLLATLRADPHYAPHATPEAVARNYRLLSTWDWLSLLLIGGVHRPRVVERVPTAGGETALTLAAAGPSDDARRERVRVDPWPFAAGRLTVVWEGRRLRGRFADEGALHDALRQAPWVTGTVELSPGA